MRTIEFTKSHGLGNDFILVDTRQFDMENIALDQLAKKWCARNFGIGADGLILAYPSKVADIKMRVINSDGSEPEMCGNGLRCFAKWLHSSKRIKSSTFTVETGAGIKTPSITQDRKTNTQQVEVDMGPAIIGDIKSITIDELTFKIHTVSMGNPHGVIFVDEINTEIFTKYGPQLATHAEFPEGINIEFTKITSPNNATVQVWERGAGATLACGTGACAVLAAGIITKQLYQEASIHLPGGSLSIFWDKPTNNITMTGPAEIIYTGSIDI